MFYSLLFTLGLAQAPTCRALVTPSYFTPIGHRITVTVGRDCPPGRSVTVRLRSLRSGALLPLTKDGATTMKLSQGTPALKRFILKGTVVEQKTFKGWVRVAGQ